MQRDGRSTVLHRDVVTYMEMRFISCTGEAAYSSLLVVIVPNSSELADAASVTHRL